MRVRVKKEGGERGEFLNLNNVAIGIKAKRVSVCFCVV